MADNICTTGVELMKCGKFVVRSKEIKKKHQTATTLKLMLCDGETQLATTKYTDYGNAMNLEGGRSYVKGHGYAKQLITCLIKSKPDVWLINTDGFTKQGFESFSKVMEENDFRIVDWRWSGVGGIGRAMRQDIIDKIIEGDERGERFIFAVNHSFHSRNKKKEK
jgi:hypothetical protein